MNSRTNEPLFSKPCASEEPRHLREETQLDAELEACAPEDDRGAKYYDPRTWNDESLWLAASLLLITYLLVTIILSVAW